MPIHLYIEHLLNIRTLSIQASLPTSSTETTRATVSADGSLLTITHDNEEASVKQPINLSPRRESTVELEIPPVPQKEFSFRFQLEAKDIEYSYVSDNSDCSDHADDPKPPSLLQTEDEGLIIPWTAGRLTSETEICCKACGTVVVERGKIAQWKDLPSEGWAEMMDFWHCHKPDHPDGPHAHGANGELKKGYAADSKLALESGVGMLDALNFVFTAEDCPKIKTLTRLNTPPQLLCPNPSCASLLGTIDPSTAPGYKLHKPSLSLSLSPTTLPISFPESKWLSLALLTATESQGVRKFTLHLPTPGQSQSQKNLKLWVFAPDLYISSSVFETNEPVRMAKVMWKEDIATVEVRELAERLSRQTLAEGELDLRDEEVLKLAELLRGSQVWMPRGSREFADGWRVGLMKRFSKVDLEGGSRR